MRSRIQTNVYYGRFKFFRKLISNLEVSEIEAVITQYEDLEKSLKDDIYRLVWYMRGGVQYQDLMYHIDVGDKAILNKIIKENWENTNKSGIALI